MIKLPPHGGSLTIKHNPHKDVDMELEAYIDDLPIKPLIHDIKDLQYCFEMNDIWIVQWWANPGQQGNFEWVASSSLEFAVQLANERYEYITSL